MNVIGNGCKPYKTFGGNSMGVEWYDMIAKRNGGYKGGYISTTEGTSAEEIFEQRLIEMLPGFQSVMDAGCGHGEFTLKMSKNTNRIIGFDNSMELLKIAQGLLDASTINNVEFVFATTKEEMPFSDGEFDLIYDRRGPTSIINHSRILKSGGTIFGIHNSVDKVEDRLHQNGLQNIEIEKYNEAITYFPNKNEFAKFLSCIPGNPDFALPDYEEELERKISENTVNGKIAIKELKYIWKAIKP
ncbi:class I SAM-dependent methyltransferase [Paenibacillus sp. TRM 82003]|nr:class I SAM-dependent methyltransferase [Paenibacillus sp. TRM 82003]